MGNVRGWFLAGLLGLCACASTSGHRSEDSDDLEDPDGVPRGSDLKMNGPAGGVNSLGATSDQTDLAASFDAPEPSHDADDADPEGDSDAAPPPAKITAQRDLKEAEFETRRQEGLKAAQGGQGDAALTIGRELETLAVGLPPWRLSHALEVQARAHLALRDAETTRKTAEAWLMTCGPDKPDGCRARALWVLERAAILGKMPNLRARVDRLREADGCVRRAEGGQGRAQGEPPECLGEAMGTYRGGRDLLMQMRVHYARGVALSGKEDKRPQAIAAFTRAEAACAEPRCVGWRRKALKRLSQLHAADGDLQRAAEAALAEAHLYAGTLPDELKLWGMTPEAEAACERLDAKAGAGTCRKLERARFSGHVFLDFSQQKSRAAEGLSADDVKRVNAHYGVLMEQCLEAEKGRMPPLSSYRYQVRWVVQNDGSVTKVRIGGDGSESTPLGQCIKGQFASWRYPRYAGEFQNVEQTFLVSARQKR